MPATCKCPNCGATLEHALFLRKTPNGTPAKKRRGQFESVQSVPPHWYNPVRRFFWFFNRNNQYDPGAIQERVIVRSEYKPTPQQTLIAQLEFPATVGELQELARVYAETSAGGLGYPWSKANTVNNTSMGGGKHDNIKEAMIELHFLVAVDSKHYELTPPGLRFLRHYLGENQVPLSINGNQ